MLSFINTNTRIPKSHHQPFARLNGPLLTSSLVLDCDPKRRGQIYRKSVVFNSRDFSFKKPKRDLHNIWSCWCRQSEGEGEGEGDGELEAEIMDFMAKSEKPTKFPTKKELMRGGRVDLVEAIRKRGGWYSLGWDEENVGGNVDEAFDIDIDIGEFQRRIESCRQSGSLRKHPEDSVLSDGNEDGCSCELNSNSRNLDSVLCIASRSLGRSLEIGADEDSRIEGILSGLEKQRNSDFGFNLRNNGYDVHPRNKNLNVGMITVSGENCEVAKIDLGGNGSLTTSFHQKSKLNSTASSISRNSEPESWRTWSNQRAGFQHTEFEAAEISFSKDQAETNSGNYPDGIFIKTEENTEDWYTYEQINHNQIRTRLQHLECDLNTALRILRSKKKECVPEECQRHIDSNYVGVGGIQTIVSVDGLNLVNTTSSPNELELQNHHHQRHKFFRLHGKYRQKVTGSSIDLRKLSDAWEFQENEFMSAKERLRSTRVKLAVLEGKMALAIIDARKIVEEKQKRIDGARKALQLLRTTCIVWPNSASDVLLAGSFDGWTSQRKLEKSSTSIFSLCLKLYPGRYEIKFIVDGKWKVDPLRPIVNNNGYENNLIIVT
ncbi:hypothetical protein OROMI_022880 [Orobanche minor]